MRSVRLVTGGLVLSAGILAVAPQPPAGSSHGTPAATPELSRVPLSFERNDGQAPGDVRFIARTGAATVFVRPAGATIARGGAAVSMRLDGARGDAPVSGEDELPGKVNWFLGRDPAHWHARIPTFESVTCRGVWPGIDLRWRGRRERVEYDFVVEPGADPSVIALSFDGAKDVSIDEPSGDLVVAADDGVLRQGRPVVWQDHGGERREVSGAFALLGGVRVGFRVDGYDPTRTLVVDPPLAFVASFGAAYEDHATGIRVDGAGDAYLIGTARSEGPSSSRFWEGMPAYTEENAFVAKLDRSGRFVHWTTYFGGAWQDSPTGLALGSGGSAYVCGSTRSDDFPVTAGSFDVQFDENPNDTPGDAFVAKLAADGTLAWATYWGGRGDDLARAIAVRPDGRTVVVGATSSLVAAPTASPFQAAPGADGQDAFLVWFSADGSAMESMTYLGGAYYDFATSVALDSAGDAIVTGGTGSPEIANTSPLRPWSGGYDLFVAKFASGDELRWFTYLGGRGSEPGYYASVATDDFGAIYVGTTTDSTDLPTGASAFQRSFGGGASDGFVAGLAADGALSWATYLGGSGVEYPFALAVAPASLTLVVCGSTDSTGFPIIDASQAENAGQADVFVARMSSTGTSLSFSTFLGGVMPDFAEAVDVAPDGAISACGTFNSSWMETPLAYQNVAGAYFGQMPFVARFAPDVPERANTMSFTVRSGRLADVDRKFWRDTFEAAGSFATPVGPGRFDPTGRAVTVAFGDPSHPVSLGLAPYSQKTRRGKFTWTTPKRVIGPRLTVALDTRRGTFSLKAQKFEFPVPPSSTVMLSVMIGDDDGSDARAWSSSGVGKLRFRPQKHR